MIIDAHTHIYPDKIARKASVGTGLFYDLKMEYNGTVDELIKTGQQAGVDKYLVHSVATSPEQVTSINGFIAREIATHREFIGFGAMHQDFTDMETEINRMIDLGLKGIKLHPDIQRFSVDDPKMDTLYEIMAGRLPLLLHAGDKRYEFSNPGRIAKVLDRFPKLDVICAHFGGYSEWDAAEDILGKLRIWVDTSSSLMFISPERARHLINIFGAERVIFGSDYPMWDVSDELERIDTLALSNDVKEMILWKNITYLLNGME